MFQFVPSRIERRWKHGKAGSHLMSYVREQECGPMCLMSAFVSGSASFGAAAQKQADNDYPAASFEEFIRAVRTL